MYSKLLRTIISFLHLFSAGHLVTKRLLGAKWGRKRASKIRKAKKFRIAVPPKKLYSVKLLHPETLSE